MINLTCVEGVGAFFSEADLPEDLVTGCFEKVLPPPPPHSPGWGGTELGLRGLQTISSL